MSPSTKEVVKIQKGLFDLDSFQEVTLYKEGEFTPVSSTQEALARVGNDSSKFLALVNEGLRAEYQRDLRSTADGWFTEDEDTNARTPFTGTIANIKAVNSLVLTLAKTVFGYSKDLSSEAKKAAKESAMNMVASTPAIKEGLKKSAALTSDNE